MPTIKNFNKRLQALNSERSTFIPSYRELSEHFLGHRGRFLTSDRNKGNKRNTKQINNTGRIAVRTLAGGMMSGITSPARPWFRLGTADPDLREYKPVKEWLSRVQSIMYRVFAQSNFYNAIHSVYAELGTFGTSPMGVFDDYEDIILCRPYTVGSYSLGTNEKGIVDTFYREYELTVSQCIKTFGIENCSNTIRDAWGNGNTELWVPIVHVIEPNDDRDSMSPLARDMKFRSVYYEANTTTGNDKFLRESGFPIFPIPTPRWEVVGEDVYASDCPGMTAIGDTKALQLGEMRGYQALDKLVHPKLQAPNSLRNAGVENNDSSIIYVEGQGKISSIYDFRPDIQAMEEKNRQVEERIKTAFYSDLFLMLSNSDRRLITAREVVEKHEEKLLMLGPVLERTHREGLDPVIDITFSKLQAAGILPPPPQEIIKTEMRVEYVSILAQAQRAVAVGALDQLGAYVGQLSAVWPEARYKFRAQQAVDEYSEALGTPPSVVRSDDEVGAMMLAEQKQMQQQQALEKGRQMIDAAKTASDTNITGSNLLARALDVAGAQ